jgi:hypothetical protein
LERRRGLTLLRVALVALVALGLAACRPDPVAQDRADLRAALDADDVLDRGLRRADDAERAGHDGEALDILKRTCEPAADRALAAATALTPRSAWGRKEKDALVALEHDRKRELVRYEDALHVGSVQAKVAAMEGQIEVEKRAATISEEIDHAP